MKNNTFTPVRLSMDSEGLMKFRHHLTAFLENAKMLTELHASMFLKREMPLDEVVELLKAADVKRELEIKYIEANNIRIEGLKVKVDALLSMADIVDHSTPVQWVEEMRKHLKALHQMRPGALSLKELHDGKQFYAPDELPKEVQGKITRLYETYTRSEKQNQIYQAMKDMKSAFEKLAALGVELPMYHQFPHGVKQLFDVNSQMQQGPYIHQIPLNTRIFTEGNFSNVS